MESFLEKVTLYDFYGYTLPGCYFLLLTSASRAKQVFGLLIKYKDTALYLFFVFLLLGFVAGLLFTQISSVVFGKILKPDRSHYMSQESLGISFGLIQKALFHAGLIDDSQKIDGANLGKYGWVMFSDIQVDPKYRRLHNYASMELLFKNMSLASAIGGVLVSWSMGWAWLYLPCFGAAVLLGWQGCQFTVKKEVYTLFWFVEKYARPQT